MNMRRISAFASLALLVCLCARQAKAEVSFSYVAASEEYGVGGTIVTDTVDLYLQETLSDGSASVLRQTDGLLGFGVQVSLLSGSASFTNTTINTTDFSGNAFQGPLGTSSVYFTASILPDAPDGVRMGNTGGGVSPGTPANEVYLGSVTITPIPNAVSVFSVGPMQPIGGNTLDNFGDDLDITNAAPTYIGAADPGTRPTVFVIVPFVPEPASAGIMVLAAMVLLPRRRKQSET